MQYYLVLFCGYLLPCICITSAYKVEEHISQEFVVKVSHEDWARVQDELEAIGARFKKKVRSFGIKHTVPSKRSGTKWKYFHKISKYMLILNDLCKQYGSRSAPTKRWAWSSIHIVWYPASGFAENWLYCVGFLELCGYINFVNLTNCPITFGGHCTLPPLLAQLYFNPFYPDSQKWT